MKTDEIISLEDQYQIPTYKKMPLALVRGEGSFVWDADGRRYLDYYGGHCVTLLGHSPKRVVRAVQEQAARLMFYSNVSYSDVRARAAARLAELAPDRLRHVFFCNSGTEANETALKIARKYTGKTKLVATKGGFHGRTLGSLAATWTPAYREPYTAALSETAFVPFGDADAARSALADSNDVAAVIIEPIQSMAGVTEAPDAYFSALREACDAAGAMLIFDEVQTGVGRTGTFSISEQLGVQPDLISMAKSLGSGMPVGAVLVSDMLAASVEYGDQGTTFGGGMLAMAAVEATLATLQDENLMPEAGRVFERLRRHVSPAVEDVRGRGCLMGIRLKTAAAPVLAVLRAEGVLAGSSGDPAVIRLMPPITTTDEEIDAFAAAFERALESVASSTNAS